VIKLNRIEAFVGTENEASKRLVKGLGFTEEGLLRGHYINNGIAEDSLVYGLLKSEFQQANKHSLHA
jgi:[ribosomal protein S5]-alanine N-acetyltransferase